MSGEADLNQLLQELDRPAKAEEPAPIKPQRAAVIKASQPMQVQKTELPRLSNASNLDDIDAIVANMNYDPDAPEAAGICHKCRRAINKSDSHVEVRSKPHHLACWTCSTCHRQLQADDYYESHHGAHNCEKCHLATLDLCVACKKHIHGGSKISQAEGGKFHTACFVCSTCQTPLSKYVEAGGRVYCEKHYAEHHNPKCVGCHKPLTSTFAHTEAGDYHTECFSCSKCHAQIGSGKYYQDRGNFVCGNCAAKK